MLNKLKLFLKPRESNLIRSITITATAILILLKPGIVKGDDNLQLEIKNILNKNPNKELIIQENEIDNHNLIYNQNRVGGSLPDSNQIKNLFLNMASLTSDEKQDFLKLRNSGIKNPNRDVMRDEIQSVYVDFKDENYKAIFICAFLDPFQTTSLGKQAFQIINTDKYYKQYFKSLAEEYVISLKLKQSEKKLKQSEDILKALQAMTKIFENYINSHKLLFFF